MDSVVSAISKTHKSAQVDAFLPLISKCIP